MAMGTERHAGGRPRERKLCPLGQKLAAALARKRITVLQLEAMSEVPRGTIYDIMDGDTREPKAATLSKLAAPLGITVDWLLASDPPKTPRRSA